MWLWVLLGVAVVFGTIDWFIVMGKNPKNWKGGKKDGDVETHRRDER